MRLTLISAFTFQTAPWLAPLRLCPGVESLPDGGVRIDSDSECFREFWGPRFVSLPSAVPGTAGTHLKRIIEQLGFNADRVCGCAWRARMMDQLGDEWCVANREPMVRVLTGKMLQVKQHQLAAAAMRAIAKGMDFINPKDIAGSVYDESVRRSQAEAQSPGITAP